MREGQVLQGWGWESHGPYWHLWLETKASRGPLFGAVDHVGEAQEMARKEDSSERRGKGWISHITPP